MTALAATRVGANIEQTPKPPSRRTFHRKPPRGGFADLHAELHVLTCREYGDVIAYYEDTLEHASGKAGRRAKRDALADAAEICHDCPLVAACRKAGRVEKYTGIAGGVAWKYGEVVSDK